VQCDKSRRSESHHVHKARGSCKFHGWQIGESGWRSRDHRRKRLPGEPTSSAAEAISGRPQHRGMSKRFALCSNKRICCAASLPCRTHSARNAEAIGMYILCRNAKRQQSLQAARYATQPAIQTIVKNAPVLLVFPAAQVRAGCRILPVWQHVLYRQFITLTNKPRLGHDSLRLCHDLCDGCQGSPQTCGWCECAGEWRCPQSARPTDCRQSGTVRACDDALEGQHKRVLPPCTQQAAHTSGR
jgi:hypothetical protein